MEDSVRYHEGTDVHSCGKVERLDVLIVTVVLEDCNVVDILLIVCIILLQKFTLITIKFNLNPKCLLHFNVLNKSFSVF